jgi:hypothetical protein
MTIDYMSRIEAKVRLLKWMIVLQLVLEVAVLVGATALIARIDHITTQAGEVIR